MTDFRSKKLGSRTIRHPIIEATEGTSMGTEDWIMMNRVKMTLDSNAPYRVKFNELHESIQNAFDMSDITSNWTLGRFTFDGDTVRDTVIINVPGRGYNSLFIDDDTYSPFGIKVRKAAQEIADETGRTVEIRGDGGDMLAGGAPRNSMFRPYKLGARYPVARYPSGSSWPGKVRLGTPPVKWPKTAIASPSTRPFSGVGDASARRYWSEGKDYNWSKGSLGRWRERSGEGLLPTDKTLHALGWGDWSATRQRSGLFANEKGQRVLKGERIFTGFKAQRGTRGKRSTRDAPKKITTGKKIIDNAKPIWPRTRSGVSGPIVKFPKHGIASKKTSVF